MRVSVASQKIVDRLLKRPGMSEVAQCAESLDRGTALCGLTEGAAISLLVGNKLNCGGAGGPLDHQLGQIEDRDLPGVADIDGFSQALGLEASPSIALTVSLTSQKERVWVPSP